MAYDWHPPRERRLHAVIPREKAVCSRQAATVLACVASVSSLVVVRKLEREQKKKNRRWRMRGEKDTRFLRSLSPPPSFFFFSLLLSQLSRRTRAEMLAMQATTVQVHVGSPHCQRGHNVVCALTNLSQFGTLRRCLLLSIFELITEGPV